ncbi:hypothetical protein [Streptomyces zagrosensis]|uniref:Uncharacterized protein n=1 Tax=Streptomyces zagrosensis TaxID=1042984 RepID=A0A7W9QDA7_9ACTN|nr:hypothetical protein [Streptomyces zagrosensis]MBB5937986.1 hypothetical protein [Streptomyces zagrosensis]
MADNESTVEDIGEVKAQSRGLSDGLLRIIDLEGDLKEPVTSVGTCGDKDADKFYRINSSWSLAGPPAQDLRGAMGRLSKVMPKSGWDITEHGRENSVAKSHYLKANSTERAFSVYIVVLEASPNSGRTRPLLYVGLASDCFQVPDGQSARDKY